MAAATKDGKEHERRENEEIALPLLVGLPAEITARRGAGLWSHWLGCT